MRETFKLDVGGETYEFYRMKETALVLALTDDDQDSTLTQGRTLLDFIFDVMVNEDERVRLEERFRDLSDPIDTPELTEAIQDLLEKSSKRPTQSPSPS